MFHLSSIIFVSSFDHICSRTLVDPWELPSVAGAAESLSFVHQLSIDVHIHKHLYIECAQCFCVRYDVYHSNDSYIAILVMANAIIVTGG